MKHLKLFESFDANYSIYDYFEDLKRMQWSNKIDLSLVKKRSDQFIGNGYFDKISSLVDSLENSFSKLDYEFIYDRLYDVWDYLPEEKDKVVMGVVAYGSYENYEEESDRKYNGMITFNDNKENIIIHIIKEILYPTLFIGYPSVQIRLSDDEIYVTDKEWNCENFNIKKYSIKSGDSIKNGDSGRRSETNIYSSDIDKKSLYSVDKVISMYKPCLLIEIGGHGNNHLTGKIELKDIESRFDDVLPMVLPEIEHEEIIWDMSRGTRKFDESGDFYNYTLKIILK